MSVNSPLIVIVVNENVMLILGGNVNVIFSIYLYLIQPELCQRFLPSSLKFDNSGGFERLRCSLRDKVILRRNLLILQD